LTGLLDRLLLPEVLARRGALVGTPFVLMVFVVAVAVDTRVVCAEVVDVDDAIVDDGVDDDVVVAGAAVELLIAVATGFS